MLAVTGILLLAMGLRLINLDSIPLWTDEGWTFWFIENQSLSETIQRVANDRHPPFYFVSLLFWQGLIGNSHFSLRLLAVFSGLITTALVYHMANNWFKRETAIYASLLFSVIDIAIYYSQEVRQYSWLAMMAVLTSALFLRYIKKPSRSVAITYLLSVTGLMLTHYFGLFIMIIQAIVGLFFWKVSFKDKRNLIFIWVGAFILYIPWMFVVISTLSSITRGVGNFPGSFQSNFTDLITILNIFFDAQIALLGGVYVIALLNLRKLTLQQAYIMVSGGGLFLIMWLLNYQVGVLSTRMIYYLTPFLMIACAHGFMQLNKQARITFLTVFLLTAVISKPIIQARLNFSDMTTAIEANYAIGDTIIVETGWTDFATDYEITQAIPESSGHIFATARIWTPDEILEEANTLLQNQDTVWLVQWLHAPIILPQLLDGIYGFELVEAIDIENSEPVAVSDPIRIYRFQQPNLVDTPIVFGENIELHEAIFPNEFYQDDGLRIDLWWKTSDIIDRDYSTSLFLMDATGQVVTQFDASIADLPSSQWQLHTPVHVTYTIPISDTIASGDYTLNAVVYYFETPTSPLMVNNQDFIELGTVTLRE
ncbi:MAG: hypothetical protein Phog2KO_24390 [Phototrophicaceae bacterium]